MKSDFIVITIAKGIGLMNWQPCSLPVEEPTKDGFMWMGLKRSFPWSLFGLLRLLVAGGRKYRQSQNIKDPRL
jgi:hypothetical protein